jgi:cytochrome c biogenesis protein CcmG, thiol:disulfide interchange protein DsbE
MKHLLFRVILLGCLLAAGNTARSQQQYYQFKNGTILDSAAYARAKASQLEKTKSLFPSKNVVLKEQFEELRSTPDSMIMAVNWDIRINDANERVFLRKTFEPEIYLNQPFPLPELTTLEGQQISLDRLRGKPILINFWFINCPPCVEEMPVLNAIKQQVGDSAHFVAVTFESADRVRKFLKKQPFHFMQVTSARKYIESLKMVSYPVNVFLDKEGIVRKIKNGIPYVRHEDGKIHMGDGNEFLLFLRSLL